MTHLICIFFHSALLSFWIPTDKNVKLRLQPDSQLKYFAVFIHTGSTVKDWLAFICTAPSPRRVTQKKSLFYIKSLQPAEGSSSRFLNLPVIHIARNSPKINCNHEEVSPKSRKPESCCMTQTCDAIRLKKQSCSLETQFKVTARILRAVCGNKGIFDTIKHWKTCCVILDTKQSLHTTKHPRLYYEVVYRLNTKLGRFIFSLLNCRVSCCKNLLLGKKWQIMKSKWNLEGFFCPRQWKTHLSANFQASMNESTLISLVFVFGNCSLGQNPKQVQPNKSNMFIHCEDQTKDIFPSYNIILSLYKSSLPFFVFLAVFRHYRLQFPARCAEV